MFHRVHHGFEDLIILDRPIDLLFVRILYTIRVWRLFTAISRKVVGKSACDNPQRYCGWFGVLCSSKKFERNVTGCLRCYVCDYWRKATKVGSTAAVTRNSVLIISHITFRDCRVHINFFPTTPLEITVQGIVSEITCMSYILRT